MGSPLRFGLWRRDALEGKRQAGHYGCRYFPTYSDLLADKSIDAVVVALPPALNASICEEPAFRRKHILLEKPMAIAEACYRSAETETWENVGYS